MTLIEMLRANGSWEADAAVTAIQVRDRRIEKLEAELRKLEHWLPDDVFQPILKVLEGKDE